jgi:hypothetical protein
MMDLTYILDDCLRRLASGEDRTAILALYPEQAHRLAPMLDAAVRLAALSGARLSEPQKLRAKVALRQAAAERAAARGATPARSIWPWLRAPLRSLPVALILAAVLVVTLSISAVASSRPGDMAYPLRVAIERVPTFVQFTPAGRAAAELDIADRRMADLGGHLSSTGQANPIALDALLEGDAAAAGRAARLSDDQRTRVAVRITAHADVLEVLAATAPDPADTLRLRAAADRSRQIAIGLTQNAPAPAAPSPDDSGGAPPAPAVTRMPTTPWPTPAPATAGPSEVTTITLTLTPVPTDTHAALPSRTPRPQHRFTVTAPPAVATRLPSQHPSSTRTPAPAATTTVTTVPAPRVRPTRIVPQSPTIFPPLSTRTPIPGWQPRLSRTPALPAATPLPTRLPGGTDWTPRPTRAPVLPGTATRMRPRPPLSTPIPSDTPVSAAAETPTAIVVETPVSDVAETPTSEAAGVAATPTPPPVPDGAPPGPGVWRPGPGPGRP